MIKIFIKIIQLTDEIFLNYIDNDNKSDSIKAYNNFKIIDKNILELFIGKIKNNIIADCYFKNTYIIITLPNNLIYINLNYIKYNK